MHPYDIVIIGGGPAGSTAALRAARMGLKAIAFEQQTHPRFHIGESLLPRNMTLMRELGLEEALLRVPHVYKIGATFGFGHGAEMTHFHFRTSLLQDNYEAVNIERAPFDLFLRDQARGAGAEFIEDAKVRRIVELSEGSVAVEVETKDAPPRVVRGRYLFDASGQNTVVGRHLQTRRTLPDLKKVASYGHFSGVFREEGTLGGYIRIIMCDEGWFWFIPLDETRTSIGLVLDAEIAKRIGVPAKDLVFWGIERCPIARAWTEKAVAPDRTWVTADFSYTCEPYAGPGYFLVGDAATFVDPIFSTGVCLGMMAANEAVEMVVAMESGKITPAAARRRYRRFVRDSSSTFFRLVRGYYRHPFRELLMQNLGPFKLHSGITSLLTGSVFPRPPFPIRWRLRLFEAFVTIQERYALAPRRTGYSLIEARPTERTA